MLRKIPMVLLSGYLLAAIVGLNKYINPLSVNWILGVVAIIATIEFSKTAYKDYRYLFAGLVFAMLYVVIPAKTFLYAAIALSLCFLAETYYGRLNRLVIICLVLMSPIFEYLSGIFSFPVRLFLTRMAGQVLAFVDPGARAEGNLIYYHNEGFSVDPACMGLQMLVASMLAGVILLSMVQKKIRSELSWIYLAVYFAGIFLLNLVCNIFRIISLVLFHIESGTVMHEVVGLVCFAVYVLIPAFYLAKKLVRAVMPATPVITPYDDSSLSIPLTVSLRSPNQKPRKMLLLNSGLLLVILTVITLSAERNVNDRSTLQPLSVKGYQVTNLPDKISKLQNARELIYIKPVAGFYASDHQPMICWKGSGFEFQQVKEKMIAGHQIYTAVLQKGQERLYTAWWYYNGTDITNSQFSWRWSALKDKSRYVLVNITTADANELENAVRKIFLEAPLKGMFASAVSCNK